MRHDNTGAKSGVTFAHTARTMMFDELRHSPIEATWAGLHDYDGEMPDLSADGSADSATTVDSGADDKGDIAAGEDHGAADRLP